MAVKMSKAQQYKHIEDLLNSMPKSRIPEIQDEIKEIHSKMKDYVGDQFFVFYQSYISSIASKITSNLSKPYAELFKKDYSNYGLQEFNPYGESPYIIIERTQQRIERAWNVVQEKMAYLRKSLENHKKILLPIIECDLKGIDADTIKAIEKIPYDSKYCSIKGGWITAPWRPILSNSVYFSKSKYDKALGEILDEIYRFREKNLLLEIIPIIQNLHCIIRRLRKLAEEKWKSDNLQNGEYKKGDRIRMHNSTGHITSPINGWYVCDALKRIKIIYPDLLKDLLI